MEDKKIQSVQRIAQYLAEKLDKRVYLQLWDGSMIALGKDADPKYYFSISGPGVIASLLRCPTLENILNHYAVGHIDFHGGDLMTFGDVVRKKSLKKMLKGIDIWFLVKELLPFLFIPSEKIAVKHKYEKDETGRDLQQRDNKEFIQFHYDVSNEFYQLFLDKEMLYSCGYFRDTANSLDQAQLDKLEMICRKLRLKPGDRLLDIGCGWGALICYAAKNYGVKAYGVTLSQTQYDFVQEKIRKLGLSDQITVELKDYIKIDGTFDKISSIGMFEHVGIANFPQYFGKLHSLLREGGILLNHGIARRAKKNKKQFEKIRAGRGWILKYIFPGSELDHIGHTLESMEAVSFEIHDVEAWREHYGRTARLWCQRLSARKDEAIKLVGPERYRMWIAYLAGVAFSFEDGSLCIYQVVASKHGRGASGLPWTREDLFLSSK